jgi:predicted protein tyrosine phosphatase
MKDRIKVLFVCSRNRWRSPTAERIFRDSQVIEARSAGTSASARHQLSIRDLEWADIVLVMETSHRERIRETLGRQARNVPVKVLGIPDEYEFMDPELVEEIRRQVGRVLPETLES